MLWWSKTMIFTPRYTYQRVALISFHNHSWMSKLRFQMSVHRPKFVHRKPYSLWSLWSYSTKPQELSFLKISFVAQKARSHWLFLRFVFTEILENFEPYWEYITFQFSSLTLCICASMLCVHASCIPRRFNRHPLSIWCFPKFLQWGLAKVTESRNSNTLSTLAIYAEFGSSCGDCYLGNCRRWGWKSLL